MTADPAPTWHVLSGDWQPLAGEPLERCKVALRTRLPTLSTHLDAESVVAHRLRLGFYDRVVDGEPRSIELCQIDLPILERHGRWLRRWLLVLWDGDDEVWAVDGSSRVIHELNQRIGLNFDEADDSSLELVRLYVRFFCALIAGDEGTFPIVERSADLGWSPANRALPLVGPAPHDPDAPALDGTPAPLTLVAEPGASGDALVYRSPSVHSTDSVVMCYGTDIFRVQVELQLEDRRETGRWHTGRVEMTDDSGPLALPQAPQPLLIRTWAAGFASLASWDGGRDVVSLASDDFAALLRDPRLAAARQGRFAASTRTSAETDGSDRALWSVVLRFWGVPDEQPILVNGDVILRPDARGRGDYLELDVPVEVRGDLIFPAGDEFGYPIRFARWNIAGRLRARGAAFAAQLELTDCTLHNRLPKVVGADGGPRDPFAQNPVQYHATAADLDEIRVTGGLIVRRLTASGELSIRGGQVTGDLLLDELLLTPRVLPLDRPILNAERLHVTGSARCRRLSAGGQVVFSSVHIEGTFDLSGSVIHDVGPGASGLRIDRAEVGGDLLLNERGWSRDADQTVATIVAGDVSVVSTEVGGNLEVTATWIMGSLDLASIQVGGRMALGAAGLASGSSGGPTHLVDSYVAEYVDLDHAKVGEMIYFDGLLVEQYLAMTGLRADGIRVAGDENPGLVVAGHDSFGRSVRLFGATIGALEVEGLRLAGSCWIVGLTVGPRFRVMPVRLPAGHYEWESAMREQATRARQFGSGATWQSVHDRFVADAREIAADAVRIDRENVLPSRMASLMMYESRCGGNLELWGLAIDAPAAAVPTGTPDRAIHVRNTTIEGSLSLHDPASRMSSADENPARDEEGPDGVITGDILIEGGRVGGTADFSASRVIGNLDLRNLELQGGLVAVEAMLMPVSDTSGGCLSLVNVRSAADLLLSGTVARSCVVRNSRIEGDLEISRRTAVGAYSSRAQLASLEATGNVIEGRILLQHLDVAGAIDLSDTRAVRGLTIGAEVGDV